jgi:NTE family protein
MDMRSELITLIKNNKLFTSIDDAGIKKLASMMREIHVKKNRLLFRQGEISDGIYLVMHGKLVAILYTAAHEKKILAEIHPGETIGEIGALSHEPRGASVKALENSILFELKQEDFFKLSHEYPEMLMQVVTILANRSRNLLELLSTREPEKKHIAILPANKDVALTAFANQLKKQLHEFKGITILADDDAAFTEEYKSQTKVNDFIAGLNSNKEKIIYILNGTDTHLARACFDNVDVMYIAGEGHSKPHLHSAVQKKIHSEELTYKAKPELILIYKNGKRRPRGTSKWLKLADFGMHHHIRINQDHDLQRLLRFMSGRATGVVLGGGGVRSWAHIGALKALKEKAIPIDIICGTSGGSIVAGYYALYESSEDLTNQLDELSQITNKAILWRHLTWPAVSLFDGDAFTRKQQEIFGKYKIENLWLPFFCVSCNLTKSTAVVHRSGKLWKKIRASTSVPGIFPPVVINGQLHLDGGIVNNLPVDLLKKFSSSIWKAIAVELIHTVQGNKEYNFPPILPLGKTFLAKMKLAYKQYKFPSFVDMFLKSLMAGSAAKQNENAQSADVLISPSLSEFDLLRVTPKQQQQLLAIGYKATLEALDKPKKTHIKHKVLMGLKNKV